MEPGLGLEGRVVVVAGAGGDGIGSATARLLARAGAHVAGLDRDASAFDAIRGDLEAAGRPHRLVVADLLAEGAAAEAIAEVEDTLGPVSGLVNVVGGFEHPDQMGGLLEAGAADTFRRLLDFNLQPALTTSVAVVERLRARGEPGAIVHITSSTGLVSMPYGAGYAASKAALVNLTRTMAVEWGGLGVRVNAVACGTIQSEHSRQFARGTEEAARRVVPLGRPGRPDEIAGAVAFLLGGLSSYVTGAVLGVDGGALARAPYNDEHDLPVFITDPGIRSRLLGD